jgi:hypothetical protein
MSGITFKETAELLESAGKGVVELSKRDIVFENEAGARILVSPGLAGKLMAAASTGVEGANPLFINESAIRNPDPDKQYDPEGGHRWWPLPEGQLDWSLYFPEGTTELNLSICKVNYIFL